MIFLMKSRAGRPAGRHLYKWKLNLKLFHLYRIISFIYKCINAINSVRNYLILRSQKLKNEKNSPEKIFPFCLSWFVNVCFPLIFHYQWKINGKMSPSRPLPSSRLLPLPPHPLPSPPSTVGSAPGPKFSQSPAPLEILGDYGADHGG